MSSQGNEVPAALRDALRLQEEGRAAGAPAFAQVARRIEAAEASPFAAPRWSARRSAHLAAALAAAQLRVVPRTVLPCMLAMAAAAVGAACFAASGVVGDEGARWWFSAMLLLGAALTSSAALSPDRADALSLAMPLGPQTVMLARMATVLGLDAAAGLVASAAFAWWGALPDVGALVASWLVPLAAVAGAAALVAVWTGAPWAGAVAGAALVPAVHAAYDGGAAFLLGGLQAAVGPEGVVALGVALLATTVCSARRAALARLREA